MATLCEKQQYLSSILDDCNACPETPEGCEVHKPLYMTDYNNCMNDCGKYCNIATVGKK